MPEQEKQKMSEQQEQKVPEKSKRLLPGLTVAAILWLWGSLLLYAPIYLGIAGWGRILFNVLGGLAIAISLLVAIEELTELWKKKAMGYWSISLVFLVPAVILHLAVMFASLPSLWETVARIVALILVFIGGPFVIVGLSNVLWKPKPQRAEQAYQISIVEAAERKADRRRANFSLSIALLTLATTIIKLVFEFHK
jgi:cation transport ATPase